MLLLREFAIWSSSVVVESSPGRHVAASLKSLMKGVQQSGEVDEEELDEAVGFRPLSLGLWSSKLTSLHRFPVAQSQRRPRESLRRETKIEQERKGPYIPHPFELSHR